MLAPATQTRDAARCDGPGEVTRVNLAVVRFLSVCEAETVDGLDGPRIVSKLGVPEHNPQAILRDSSVAPWRELLISFRQLLLECRSDYGTAQHGVPVVNL